MMSAVTSLSKTPIRMSLEMSPEAYARLQQLAASIDGTESEVLSKAVALLEIALEAKRAGKKIGVASNGQQLEQEITGL